jgi:membrane-associated phospholipid phosphatase
MKVFFWVFLTLPVLAQTEAPIPAPQRPAVADQGKPSEAPASAQSNVQTPAARATNRSVINPKPGGAVLKPKDYSAATGYLHPFVRMPKYILMDQKAIWTSPFHTSKRDAKWWAIFGGGTVALIATDKYVSKNAPNPHWLRTLGSDVSYLGDPYTLIPIAAGFYFGGTAMGSDHLREAGLLSFEALANATIVELALKSIFDRQRPLEGHGNGEFWASTSPRYNSGFPSGHAIETFCMASVFAHQYTHKLWVKILAYGYAGGVVGARLAANQHFPGDVLAGGAMGWFIGDYVYGKRHNSGLDKKPTITQRILDHVQIGRTSVTVP